MKEQSSPDNHSAKRFLIYLGSATVFGCIILGMIIYATIKYYTTFFIILLVLSLLLGILLLALRSNLHNERKKCHCQQSPTKHPEMEAK